MKAEKWRLPNIKLDDEPARAFILAADTVVVVGLGGFRLKPTR